MTYLDLNRSFQEKSLQLQCAPKRDGFLSQKKFVKDGNKYQELNDQIKYFKQFKLLKKDV